MGQQQTSEYSHNKEIEQAIHDDKWMSINDKEIIDMSTDIFENPFKHKYTIKFNSDIPSNCNMAILFPNHPLSKKRVLWTKSYLGNLNQFSRELNDRIQKSNRDHLSVIITSGNHLYQFQGFVGNLYLWWAETINIERVNQIQNEILRNVPVLVETNGQMNCRSLFIFKESLLVNLNDATFFEPIDNNLYCCETDPRKNEIKPINTLSNEHANQMAENLVLRRIKELPGDELPYPLNDDLEFEEVVTDRIPVYSGENDPSIPDEN